MTRTVAHFQSSRASGHKTAYTWLWFGLACTAIVAWVWPVSPLFLETLLIVLLALPVVRDLLDGSFDAFELRNMFCLGYFLQFVVSTWYSQNVEYRYVSQSFFATYVSRALTLAIIGLLSYYAGYYAPLGPLLASRLKPLNVQWQVTKLPAVVIAFLIVAFGSWLVLLRQLGGLSFVLTHLYNITELVEGMTFLFSLTAGFFYAAIALCELHGLRSGLRKYRLAAAMLAAVNIAVLLTRGYKFPFAIVALVFWVPRHYLETAQRRGVKLWKVLIAIAVAVLVPYYQLFRGNPESTPDLASIRALNVTWTNALPLVFRRYYGVEVFSLILSKVGHGIHHAMGSSLLLFFANFVPRALWPGKPLGPSSYVTALFFDNRFAVMTGTEPSIPGELYWNFGVLGIIIGMAILGMICRLVYVYFVKGRNTSCVLFYLPWVFWAFECNDGNLADGVYSFLLVYTVPLLLGHLMLAHRIAHPSRRNELSIAIS